MARPAKKGLDYYPSDTNRRNDFKIMDLLNQYGPLGYTIYDFCLQYVYENGYFLDVPLQQVCLTLCRDIGAKWIKNKNLVGQVIDYCADIGLFDKDLLRQNVMTSVGIQRRYDSVTVRNKVDKSKFWLLGKENCEAALINAPKNGVSATETKVIATETEVSATNMPQIKVNKIKEKEKKTDVFISLLLKDESDYQVTFSQLNNLKNIYTLIDVENELVKMSKYFELHPDSRKSLDDIKNYIDRWLLKRSDEVDGIRKNNSKVPAKRRSTGAFNTGEVVL
ncbi:DUF4373 domain-containing protein [Eubacterium sp. OM08-24]|uniref:DUF4373 domain-containing protein n=1 Tax=Eubacterium sp. OM08-24 TaxID=2292352 RepID=UPI0013146AEA|nr:DUF4373 domain-containing protein [Eubacterium sp. OM08-24]